MGQCRGEGRPELSQSVAYICICSCDGGMNRVSPWNTIYFHPNCVDKRSLISTIFEKEALRIYSVSILSSFDLVGVN
jgi:hypothetical protein